MALKSIYEGFLESPTAQALSESCSLNYITSLTSISQPASIIRHLDTQNRNIVKRRYATVLSAVEGSSSLAVEVSTSIEFMSGGGAYLLGLDNVIAGKTATLPMVSPPS